MQKHKWPSNPGIAFCFSRARENGDNVFIRSQLGNTYSSGKHNIQESKNLWNGKHHIKHIWQILVHNNKTSSALQQAWILPYFHTKHLNREGQHSPYNTRKNQQDRKITKKKKVTEWTWNLNSSSAHWTAVRKYKASLVCKRKTK